MVQVVLNKDGQVVTNSAKNADYGWITLRTEQEEFNNGFLRFKQRFAFLTGTLKELGLFIAKYDIVEGSELRGRIVIKESLEPVDATNPETGIKFPNAAAKEVGLACLVKGAPVYRRSFFTQDDNIMDEFVAHDNNADIKAFMLEQQALATKANTPGLRKASPVKVK